MKYSLPSFKDKSFDEIIQMVQSVPERFHGNSVDQIDFSLTGIFELSEESALIPLENKQNGQLWSYGDIVENIVKIINAIPPHIKHVNFSLCNFAYANTGLCNDGRLTFEQAELLYAAIGNPRFSEITFWKDDLGLMPNLEQLFRNLHQQRINIAWCRLWQAPISKLEHAAKSFPDTVKYINIADNGLQFEFELRRFIAALSTRSLQEINVAGNDIDNTTYYSPSEVVSIFGELSKHCKISGIGWERICEEALRPKVALVSAEIFQAKEDAETSHLSTSFALSDKMSLDDCINVLSNLFASTRYQLTLFSKYGNNYFVESEQCRLKCELELHDVRQLISLTSKHSHAPMTLKRKLAQRMEGNYEQKFEHDMLVYTQVLHDTVDHLPDSRKKMGEALVDRMLFLMKEFLFKELPATFSDLSCKRTEYNL